MSVCVLRFFLVWAGFIFLYPPAAVGQVGSSGEAGWALLHVWMAISGRQADWLIQHLLPKKGRFLESCLGVLSKGCTRERPSKAGDCFHQGHLGSHSRFQDIRNHTTCPCDSVGMYLHEVLCQSRPLLATWPRKVGAEAAILWSNSAKLWTQP